jgi:MFS family permease
VSRRDRLLNFVICLIDAIGFPAGIAFFSQQTVLPTFLTHCGASAPVVGAMLGLSSLLQLGPGLLVMGYLGRQKQLKYYLFWVALAERFCLLPMAFLAPLWGKTHPTWLLIAMFLAYSGHSVTMGVNIPAYWTVVAKCVPANWRGRMYGIAGGLAGLLGLGTDWLMRHIVFAGENHGFPNGYGQGFLIGFLVLTITVIPFLFLREPEGTPLATTNTNTNTNTKMLDVSVLVQIWREDHRFRRFARSLALFMLCNLATPFFVLDAQRRFGGDADVARYTSIGVVAGSLGSLGIGWLADHFGNLKLVIFSCGLAVGAFLLAILAPSGSAYTVVFGLWALSMAGVDLTAGNFMMELARSPERIPSYSTLFNVVRAVPRAIAPAIGGRLGETLGFTPLFWFCGGLAAVSLLLLSKARSENSEKFPDKDSNLD